MAIGITPEGYRPERIVLTMRKYAAQQRVGPATLDSMDLSTWQDEVTSQLVISLTAHVLTQQLDSHTVTESTQVQFEVPASWWQHYKRDVLSRWRLTRWFVRWRPVRTAVETRVATCHVTWEQAATFPEARIAVDPRLGQHRLNLYRQRASWRVSPTWRGDPHE